MSAIEELIEDSGGPVIRWALAALLVAAVVLAVTHANWRVIDGLDFSSVWKYREALLRGLYWTLGLTVVAAGFGFLAGTILAVISQSPFAPARWAVAVGQIIDGGIVAQTEATIERIRIVLEEAGCRLDQVVKANVWLDDPRDFGPFNEVFRKHFGSHLPARSTLVSPLVLDGKVEIEVVAYDPRPAA